MHTPGAAATSVPWHLEMVLLFADGPHGGDRVCLARVLLHSLLPAEAECQATGHTPHPPGSPPLPGHQAREELGGVGAFFQIKRDGPWPTWVCCAPHAGHAQSCQQSPSKQGHEPHAGIRTAQHHEAPRECTLSAYDS